MDPKQILYLETETYANFEVSTSLPELEVEVANVGASTIVSPTWMWLPTLMSATTSLAQTSRTTHTTLGIGGFSVGGTSAPAASGFPPTSSNQSPPLPADVASWDPSQVSSKPAERLLRCEGSKLAFAHLTSGLIQQPVLPCTP